MIQQVLETLAALGKALGAVTADSWTAISGVLAIATLPITILFGVSATWLAAIPIWRDRKQKTELREAFGADSYDADQIDAALTHYIKPDCSVFDPAGEDDIRHAISFRKPLFEVFEQYLTQSPSERHVLLLADTGMGKTSFLLNYYARNRRRRSARRKRIAMVPLSRHDALQKIEAVQDKNETIIFLDAFDEDAHAIQNHHARLAELMEACSDFRRVVISCRTQFFAADDEVPKETGVAIIEPRQLGVPRTYKLYKIYLAPFSEKQIRRYLTTRFPIWMLLKRRRATRLIKSISDLAVRPMLLSAIPELVNDGRDVASVAELYEFLIDGWLQREARWIEVQRLKEFSEALAVDIFINRRTRGMEKIPLGEAADLLRVRAAQIETWQLTARSLVNRDAAGNIKFAHRSIMEYLFVKACLRGERSCGEVAWTDFMKEIFFSLLSSDATSRRQLTSSYHPDDFARTGLFPALKIKDKAPKGKSPVIVRPRDCVEPLHPLHESAFNERVSALIHLRDWRLSRRGEAFIDFGCGRSWRALNTLEVGEEFPLYLDDVYVAQAARRDGEPTLPSVSMFLFFYLFCGGAPFIARDVLYWTNDSDEPNSEIAVSVGARVMIDTRLSPESALGMVGGEGGSPETLFTYRVTPAVAQRSQQVKGLSIVVDL